MRLEVELDDDNLNDIFEDMIGQVDLNRHTDTLIDYIDLDNMIEALVNKHGAQKVKESALTYTNNDNDREEQWEKCLDFLLRNADNATPEQIGEALKLMPVFVDQLSLDAKF